jgi:flagellar hook-length control protein FliK
MTGIAIGSDKATLEGAGKAAGQGRAAAGPGAPSRGDPFAALFGSSMLPEVAPDGSVPPDPASPAGVDPGIAPGIASGMDLDTDPGTDAARDAVMHPGAPAARPQAAEVPTAGAQTLPGAMAALVPALPAGGADRLRALSEAAGDPSGEAPQPAALAETPAEEDPAPAAALPGPIPAPTDPTPPPGPGVPLAALAPDQAPEAALNAAANPAGAAAQVGPPPAGGAAPPPSAEPDAGALAPRPDAPPQAPNRAAPRGRGAAAGQPAAGQPAAGQSAAGQGGAPSTAGAPRSVASAVVDLPDADPSLASDPQRAAALAPAAEAKGRPASRPNPATAGTAAAPSATTGAAASEAEGASAPPGPAAPGAVAPRPGQGGAAAPALPVADPDALAAAVGPMPAARSLPAAPLNPAPMPGPLPAPTPGAPEVLRPAPRRVSPDPAALVAPPAAAAPPEGAVPRDGVPPQPVAGAEAARPAEPTAQAERAAASAAQAGGAAGGEGGQNQQNPQNQQNGGAAPQNAGQPAGAIDASRSAVRAILDTRLQDFELRLAREVETAVRGMRSGLELSLRPRNLGEVKITIELVQDRAQVQIVTETAAAARLLAGGEERLSQMLDQSGIRLGAMVAQAGGGNGQGGRGGERGARGAPIGGVSDRKAAEMHRAGPLPATRKLEQTETSINLIA